MELDSSTLTIWSASLAWTANPELANENEYVAV
jgi:hypothetical protein